MWKVRYYVPLVGFVLPTVVIGYGFVIPHSCIAGVNQLSVGFASTIFGAVLTYFAGIRSATRPACPASMPWRVRVARYLNRQAATPRGLFGRVLGTIWRFEHRAVNVRTLELLEIEPHHHVLEIGCGPGVAVQAAAALATAGHVTGLDVSETMLALATRRSRRAVARGKVTLRATDGVDLQLPETSIDRAFAVHSIYFWKDPDQTLAQLAAALRPGGRLVLAFRPAGPTIPDRFRDPIYRFYTPAQLTDTLERAGFSAVAEHGSAPDLRWLVAHVG